MLSEQRMGESSLDFIFCVDKMMQSLALVDTS